MKIFKVPNELKSPPHHYPPHDRGPGIEDAFGQYFLYNDIRTSATYLPIYWTNNYHAQARKRNTCQLCKVDAAEELLGQLDPQVQYFTVVQCDDGVYEQLSNNVFVFGSGGVGDEPVPLLCDPHPPQANSEKEFLASFVGHIEIGGPIVTNEKPTCSSSNRNGAGAVVRRRMKEVFDGLPDCLIVEVKHDGQDMLRFRDIATRSKFGLAPRGYGKTSYRLYEMFSLGTIPVYIYDEPWLPYQDVIDWSQITVLWPSSRLEELPDILRSITSDWILKARREIERLFYDFFTIEGCCKQIARMVEKKWPTE